MNRAGALALDLLFPRRCLWCGAVVGFGACEACERAVPALMAEPLALTGIMEGRVSRHVAQVCYCCQYEGPARALVHRFKFKARPELASEMAAIMAEYYHTCGLVYDVLLPIPQTMVEARGRGYNQSQLLAEALGKKLQLPVEEKALAKLRETQRQAGLAKPERVKNVQGAFGAKQPAAIVGKRVLLVDDVVTTGATLEACATALLSTGAAACGALCFAGATTG